MIKLPIKYEDFEGNQQTTTAHFHFNKLELINLGIESKMDRFEKVKQAFEEAEATNTQPPTSVLIDYVEVFEEILGAAYGIRSEDGTRFVKSPEVSEQLKQSAWYADWLFAIVQRPEEIVSILDQLVPKDFKEAANQQNAARPQDHLAPKVPTNKVETVHNESEPLVETPEQMEARIRAQIAHEQ